MAAVHEGTPDREESPETFRPVDLTDFLYDQFDRAFMLDSHAADNDSLEINNGRFTHIMHPALEKRPLLQNTWRINLQPPSGSKRHSKARVYLALDPGIDVEGGEPFSPAGRLYVEERIGRIWKPLVTVDEVGATFVESVEALEFNSADDLMNLFAASKGSNPAIARSKEIFDRLRLLNLAATVS